MPDPLLDRIFSLAGLSAMIGWVALAVAPLRPRIAQAVAGWIIPAVISAAYAGLLARYWGEATGGFGSLAGVSELFDHRGLLLAGWLHYLAFDLLIGAWEVREGERAGLPHLAVLPALALTFLFGPVGLLVFLALRFLYRRRTLTGLEGEAA